ncbi:acyl-CoA thioesterase [Singulisphaera acidiphila]|uniref:Acyl-CoA thioester hydrolase, YbgC/YbaW family n=1 Tax=Singulisphaera acidiphila (strain ATCC BAA-1392 / DSM 18658 / VKM B-2454 / MOB10) TaxID=886293 RepID=L0DRV1_SINAD|nr:thioesterase family protein [Singulisphaera acidiphila]AGA31121.1 acyl-CoA thioester hydrolase, YbgC/YbaW family [Singulisphaera acidiphila DSM 18658]
MSENRSQSHETQVRVRYAETDRMGLLHHANYIVYFEMGRTELLRERGVSYRDLEDSGHLLVVVEIGCKFKKPAYYDDLLTIRTTVSRVTHVKVVHQYQVFRDGMLLAEGHSTLACVDREGKPQALPDVIRADVDNSNVANRLAKE